MSKIDETIRDVAYILDCLIALRRIQESGSCNDCICISSCDYKPKLGEQVRYNCPFYVKEKARNNHV